MQSNLIEILSDRLDLLAHERHLALIDPVPVQTDGHTMIFYDSARIFVCQGRQPVENFPELGQGIGDSCLHDIASVPETDFQSVIACKTDWFSCIEIALESFNRSGADDGDLYATEPCQSQKSLFQLFTHHRQIRMVGIIYESSVPIKSQKEFLSF